MKKILLCMFLLYGMHAFAGNTSTYVASPDTAQLPQILALPLQTYIGKPVDSLLNVLPGGYSSRMFMVARVGRAKGIFQSYFTSQTNNCYVEVYVDNFQFMTFPNYTATTTWSMTTARTETISFIKVFKNSTVCVYGCNVSNYSD